MQAAGRIRPGEAQKDQKSFHNSLVEAASGVGEVGVGGGGGGGGGGEGKEVRDGGGGFDASSGGIREEDLGAVGVIVGALLRVGEDGLRVLDLLEGDTTGKYGFNNAHT